MAKINPGGVMEKVICPQCKKEGKKSMVYPYVAFKTLMYCAPFYDPEGRFHIHDSNVTTTEYSCSNGHEWTEKTSGECWCGWKGMKEPT